MGCASSVGTRVTQASNSDARPATTDEPAQAQVQLHAIHDAPASPIGLIGQNATTGTPVDARLPGDGRKLVLIIWDIENVRLPENTAPGLSPKDVVCYLKKHFIQEPGRTEHRTCIAITEASLQAIKYIHPSFIEELVPHCSVLLASAAKKKRDADFVLKKEIQDFTNEYAPLARAHPGQYTIALVTGDEDYLGVVQGALRAGFSVELVHHDSASGALLAQNYSRPPCLWSHLLHKYSGVRDVSLPYGDNRLLRLLSQGGILVAPFERRRGGFGAAEGAVRAALRSVHYGGSLTTTVVDPSNGFLAQTERLGVVVTPTGAGSWAEVEAAAVASGLRMSLRPGGAAPGGLEVIEARRVLRVTLKTDEAWIPGAQEGSSVGGSPARGAGSGIPGGGGSPPQPGTPGSGNGDGSSGGGTPGDGEVAVAGGRGPTLRLEEASRELSRHVGGYGSGGLQMLCRVGRVPRPGMHACTILYYLSDPRDVTRAAPYLKQIGPDLAGRHGVELAVAGVLEPEDDVASDDEPEGDEAAGDADSGSPDGEGSSSIASSEGARAPPGYIPSPGAGQQAPVLPGLDPGLSPWQGPLVTPAGPPPPRLAPLAPRRPLGAVETPLPPGQYSGTNGGGDQDANVGQGHNRSGGGSASRSLFRGPPSGSGAFNGSPGYTATWGQQAGAGGGVGAGGKKKRRRNRRRKGNKVAPA